MKYLFEYFPTIPVQMVNYLSSNIEDCTIDKRKTIQLKKIN